MGWFGVGWSGDWANRSELRLPQITVSSCIQKAIVFTIFVSRKQFWYKDVGQFVETATWMSLLCPGGEPGGHLSYEFHTK